MNDKYIAEIRRANSAVCKCSEKSQDLVQAAESGCMACCAKYMDQAGRLAEDKTALMAAAEKGHLDVAGLLVHREAKMQNQNGRTALMCAAENGKSDLVEFLLPFEAQMQD